MAGTSIPSKRGLPGVYKIENDISTVTSPEVAIQGAALIKSDIGVVNQIKKITTETQMARTFGNPTDDNFDAWFNITQVFEYKNQGLGGVVNVIRVVGADSTNSGLSIGVNQAPATPVYIGNDKDVDSLIPVFEGDATLNIYTKFPTNKKYSIAICKAEDFETALIRTGIKFSSAMEDSPEKLDDGTWSPNQFCVAVLDEEDVILETMLCSTLASDKDDNNISLGVETQINDRSNHIVAWTKKDSEAPASFVATVMEGGTYNEPTDAEMNSAYEQFSNIDTIQIQTILGSPTSKDACETLCQTRGDCSYRLGIPVGLILGLDEVAAKEAIVDSYKNSNNTDLGSIVSEIKMIDDVYNGVKRWISMAGDMVGLRFRQNLSREPWFSDGGYNYGLIQNAKKLGQEFGPASQRELIKARFNPVIAASGIGLVKIEQQNFTSKKSALRDENVRELINHIFRTASVFLKFKLHELNDEYTRYDVQSKMSRFLANVQAGRGIRKTEDGGDGYRVICNSTNNTDDVINQNMLIIDLTFLPARAITEIFLRVNIAATGVQLDIK